MPRGNGGMGCACGLAGVNQSLAPAGQTVRVLEEKLVAGFNATVLETESATELVKWLKDPDTPAFRIGLYASLLGHCGTPKDVAVSSAISTFRSCRWASPSKASSPSSATATFWSSFIPMTL